MSETGDMTDLKAFREYVTRRYGTDFGASDDVLAAYLDRGEAYVRTGAHGSAWWKAGCDLHDAYMGPPAPLNQMDRAVPDDRKGP